jgi:hypothetical protein
MPETTLRERSHPRVPKDSPVGVGRRLGRRLRHGIDAALCVALAPLRLDFSGMELEIDPDETWM